MPRIRNIKPEFFKHERLSELSAHHRLLLIGLWTLADKAGRLEDRPKRIKAELFPYEELDVETMLKDLEKHSDNFLTRYKVKDCNYIQINGFSKHQRPHHKEADSAIPVPAPLKHRESTVPARRKFEVGSLKLEAGKKNLKLEAGSLINPPNPPSPTIVGQPPAVQNHTTELLVVDTRTPHQVLIDRFLQIKGVKSDDKQTVSAWYKRHSRSALSLIQETGGVENALQVLEWGAELFDKKQLTWTLDTIAKHFPEFMKHSQDDALAAKYGMNRNQISGLRKINDWKNSQERLRNA